MGPPRIQAAALRQHKLPHPNADEVIIWDEEGDIDPAVRP